MFYGIIFGMCYHSTQCVILSEIRAGGFVEIHDRLVKDGVQHCCFNSTWEGFVLQLLECFAHLNSGEYPLLHKVYRHVDAIFDSANVAQVVCWNFQHHVFNRHFHHRQWRGKIALRGFASDRFSHGEAIACERISQCYLRSLDLCGFNGCDFIRA